MEREKARLLLENLLQRIERSQDSGKLRLDGALSEGDWEALILGLEALGGSRESLGITGTKASVAVTETEPERRAKQRESQDMLKGAACLKLNEVQDPDVTLCLDFGTAMSKAFAVKGDQLLDLGLGRRAQEPGVVYPVTSSVWIEKDGRIFFGHEAVARSLKYGSADHGRFDSMKQQLSQGLPGELDEMPLKEGINPCSTRFTVGDVITLYLGYLTDLAVTELSEANSVSRYVRRNFALPCWSDDRRKWGEEVLHTLLARAQVVADVLHGKWNEGVPASHARALLDAIRGLSNLPLYLVGRGVLEPLAAGSSRVRADKAVRGLVMVVDIGAGTTDFALFYVRKLDDGRWKAWHIKGATDAIRQAGDTVDNVLYTAILKAAGVSERDSNAAHVTTGLRSRIRQFKERLFQDGELVDRLENDAPIRIALSSFLEHQGLKRFGDTLRSTFQAVLEKAHASFFERLAEGGLSVVLTGGGATMPIIQSLSQGQSRVHGHSLVHRATPLVPEFLIEEAPALASAYPQLAVAMGGASPDVIEEMASLDQMPGARRLDWRLGGYYTKGN